MSRRQSDRRAVNGILLLDKPSGISSNAALQRVKRIYNAQKAGHTGSLDPLACGMLPICFGEATKFSQYLLESNKIYRVTARLGIRTTTSDQEGEVVSERPIPTLTETDIDYAFNAFRGEIEQVPSMYSALKYQGRPLYQYARQGITIDRPSRRVTVFQLSVTGFSEDLVHFDMSCSKGTYVRTLVDDFGEMLGCGAHVVALRRLEVTPYASDDMVHLSVLEEADGFEALDCYLLPMSTAVVHMPEVTLTESMAFYCRQGQAIISPHAPTEGMVRLSLKNGDFLGVAEAIDGKIQPRRMIQGHFA